MKALIQKIHKTPKTLVLWLTEQLQFRIVCHKPRVFIHFKLHCVYPIILLSILLIYSPAYCQEKSNVFKEAFDSVKIHSAVFKESKDSIVNHIYEKLRYQVTLYSSLELEKHSTMKKLLKASSIQIARKNFPVIMTSSDAPAYGVINLNEQKIHLLYLPVTFCQTNYLEDKAISIFNNQTEMYLEMKLGEQWQQYVKREEWNFSQN